MLIRASLFIFKFSNKKLNWKNVINLLFTAIFYIASMFIEQLKSHHSRSSLFGFTFSLTYIGIWLFNRLCSGFMQTEAFRIDFSKIINNLEQTFKSDLQACLLVNEPATYDFLESKKKFFPFMFPNKPRHIYQAGIMDIVNFIKNYNTRIFIANSIFVRSVGWSICSYLKVSCSVYYPINSTTIPFYIL